MTGPEPSQPAGRVGADGAAESRPHPVEQSLAVHHVHIERKSFTLALKENARGRFLRITEDFRDQHETIIVPATGLEEFGRVVAELVRLSAERPLPPGV